jgi:hypothetical protein
MSIPVGYRMKLRRDLTGQKFNRLTVIDRGPNIGPLPAWNCRCDCGQQTVVPTTRLVRNQTMSCGCLRKEISASRSRENSRKRWWGHTPDHVAKARNLKARTDRYHRNLRLSVLSAYGGRCACCLEDKYEFLAIDHINGGGSKHRQSEAKTGLYQWLKNNNYPEGFQVLCHNCNMAKGFYGSCPHEKDRVKTA